MGSRQIVLVSTAGFSVLNTGIFWREAKTKRLFSQCTKSLAKNGFSAAKYVCLEGIKNTRQFRHQSNEGSFPVTYFMYLII
jgi:hypothetical protein